MKLRAAIVMGLFCGLKTVEECILNVEHHAISLFNYEYIRDELLELYTDRDNYAKGTLELDWDKIEAEVAKNMAEYEDSCAKKDADAVSLVSFKI